MGLGTLSPKTDNNRISLLESALTGELKITRLSTINGSPAGDEDLFMFVEKVGKSKIFAAIS